MGGLEMSVDHSGYVAGAESNEESRDIAGPGSRKNKCMEYSSRHRTISADETMMDDVVAARSLNESTRAVAAIRDAAPPIVIKRLRRELNLMWGNDHSTHAIVESMMIRSPEPIKKDPIIKVNTSVRNRLFLVIQYVGSKTPNTCIPMYEGSANKN
ncbi:hypothetical protein ACTGNK_10675 [Bifidobacterium longum]